MYQTKYDMNTLCSVQLCSFLCNVVNAARGDMCNTSMESTDQGLHFNFLRLRALSNSEDVMTNQSQTVIIAQVSR